MMLKIFLSASAALAWWDHGHMLCPKIARKTLEAGGDATDAVSIIETLTQLWQATGDLPTSKEFASSFEFLGPFPDYMKQRYGQKDDEGNTILRGYSENYFDTIHYWNCVFPMEEVHANCATPDDRTQVCPDGGKGTPVVPDDVDFGLWKHDGVVGFLQYQERNLLCTNSCPENVGDKEWNAEGFRWGLSNYVRQLALFIHNYGDIHMPLHVGGISSSTCYPSGDLGGNLIILAGEESENPLYLKLYQQSGVANLHALWDSMLWHEGAVEDDSIEANPPRTGYFPTYVDLYTEEDNLLEQDATRIMEEFPIGDYSEGEIEIDILDIAKESQEICTGIVLDPDYLPYGVWGGCTDELLPLKFDPTDEYIQNAHLVSKERIALCGYRLANILPDIIAKMPVESILEDVRAGFQTDKGKDICLCPTDPPEPTTTTPTYVPQTTPSTSTTTVTTTTYSRTTEGVSTTIVPSNAYHATAALALLLMNV